MVEGAALDGPPPNSRSGYAGAVMRKGWDWAMDGTLEDTWKEGKKKLDKVMDDNAQKVKGFWDSSNILTP